MRYHHTPTRMTKIQNINNTKCWRGCRKGTLSFIAGGNTKWYTATLEDRLPVSYKAEHVLTI